jgi:hypothetical protein
LGRRRRLPVAARCSVADGCCCLAFAAEQEGGCFLCFLVAIVALSGF